MNIRHLHQWSAPQTNKRVKHNKSTFVADLLAVLKDRNVLRVLQNFLTNSFKDQASLATTSVTAFRCASNAHLTRMRFDQVCLPSKRLHMATRILWPAVHEVIFNIEPSSPDLPTQYIAQNVRGLDPTCIKFYAFTSSSDNKVKMLVDRVKAQKNETPPDDLLAERVYTKCGEVSADVMMDALKQVEWDQEHAMYYLLAEHTATEDEAVQDLCRDLKSVRGSFKSSTVRAAMVKHAMDSQHAFDYLLDLSNNARTLSSDALSRLGKALKTSAGSEPRLLQLRFEGISAWGRLNITSQGLLRIAENFRHLRTLHFATKTILDTKTMQTLVNRCPCLEDIDILSPAGATGTG